jgi:nucleotide-binding universal stress UspA family protein
MARDLRDVVNKIIVAISEGDPTSDEIAGLASDLAAFFDASVVVVYLGKLPLSMPQGEAPLGQAQMGSVVNAMEEGAKKTLDKMVEVMVAHGVQASSRIVISTGVHPIRDIIEEEKCDLVIVPHWESGAAQRLLRVFSPSIIEEATCPVLVLKGNKWLSESKAVRPSRMARLPAS